jgi:Heavy metal binding domain
MMRSALTLGVVATCAGLIGLHGQTTQPRVALRFHHLHYAVDDPGAALGEAAERLKGTRAIVQGVGVGVRIGREYVLFDRATDTGRAASVRPRSAGEAYGEALQWLTSRGFVVGPPSLAGTAVPEGFPSGTLDHVAFAADDPRVAVAALADKPLSATDDVVKFRLSSGLLLEIVRDTDRPDTHWCPMHPDVRAPGQGTCPICRMALVTIPPPRIGEYRLDVDTIPRAGGGLSGLRLTVRDPDSGEAVSKFTNVHERPFHLFVISRDLAMFAHVHPERLEDGSFALTHDLPAGEYMLIADFLPVGGTSQLVQRAIVTPGYGGPLFTPPPPIPSLPSEQVVGGVRIRMEPAPAVPRRETLVRFEVTDAATGQPVTDLEPYLGASGHLLVVNSDLTSAIHGHPEGAATGGPAIAFGPVFPAAGRYKLWVQFQRKGSVLTAPFVIDVPSESR